MTVVSAECVMGKCAKAQRRSCLIHRIATPLPPVHSRDITAMDAHLAKKEQGHVVQTGRAFFVNPARRNYNCMHHTPCIKCDCTIDSQSVCPVNKHQILCDTICKCRFGLTWTKANRTNYSPVDWIQFFTLWYSTCCFSNFSINHHVILMFVIE